MMDLKNKSVLVTGAAMGLGKLYAEEFLKRGAKVKTSKGNSILKLAEFAYMNATMEARLCTNHSTFQ